MEGKGGGTKYVIEAELGDNGGHLLFRNIDALEAWAAREREFWAWLTDSEIQSTQQVGKFSEHVIGQIDRLMAHVNQWKKNATDRPNQTSRIKRILLEQYGQRYVLHSSTPVSEFVAQLSQEIGKVEAAAALAKYCHQTVDLNDFRQFRGAVALVVFLEAATPKTTPAVRRSLKKIADDYSERYRGDVKATDDLRETLKSLVDEQTELKERGLAGMAKSVVLARRQARAQRDKTAKQLAEFEDLYNAKLSLDAPVKYWKDKRLKHRCLAGIFSLTFIVYLVVSVWAGLGVLSDTALTELDFWREASLSVFGLALAVVGIVVALARVLLRLAMSQLHLGNDADERVAMINTYLALRQGGHADEGHMKIVLERLFAPATDGIVKDDFGPVTAVDAIRAAATRSR